MKEYLKMSDVFLVDGDADFAVLLPMSVKPEYDDCVTPHDYATHAINSHDELVAEVDRLQGIIDRVISTASDLSLKSPATPWGDGYKECALATARALEDMTK